MASSSPELFGVLRKIFPRWYYSDDSLPSILKVFSKKAIKKYNQGTGKTFKFVKLVEAWNYSGIKGGQDVITFKAKEPENDVMLMTFKAVMHYPQSREFHLKITSVVLLHTQSYLPPASESKSESDTDPEAGVLFTNVRWRGSSLRRRKTWKRSIDYN